MFDINTIINNAIAEAVNARITELLQQHANIVGALEQRITSLEEKVSYLDNRLTASAIAMGSRLEALENNPAIGVDTTLAAEQRTLAAEQRTLAARVTALEESKGMTAAAFVTYLDQQEWFWEKVSRFVADNSVFNADDLKTLKDRIEELEEGKGVTEERVEELIEKSMDNHLECYNHDEYDDATSTINDYDFDDFLTKDDLNSELRDQINDTLSNASVSISV